MKPISQDSTTAIPRPPLEETKEPDRSFVVALVAEAFAIVRGFENWMPVIWRLLWGRLRRRPPALCLRTRSGPILTTLAGDRSWRTAVEVFGRSSYRLATMELPDAPTVLDIGANLGAFTLAVQAARPKALITAYEPSPAAFRLLQLNVAANHSSVTVTIHPVAVAGAGSAPAVVLVERPGDLCTSSILTDLLEQGSAADRIIVPCRSLAEVLAEFRHGVDLLKIDTEGAEYAMLCTTSPNHLRTVARIVCEYHPVPGHDFQELAMHLDTAGFMCLRHERASIAGQGLGWWVRRTG